MGERKVYQKQSFSICEQVHCQIKDVQETDPEHPVGPGAGFLPRVILAGDSAYLLVSSGVGLTSGLAHHTPAPVHQLVWELLGQCLLRLWL